jgi:choline kinase
MGRGPGFYKLDADAGRVLAAILTAMVDEGHAREEYEDALTRLFRTHDVWPIDVGDLAWTEIDHAQDLARAETEIWPRISSARAARCSPP